MREHKFTAERLATFSDGIFAVALTVLALELKPRMSRHSPLSGLCGPQESALR